MSATATKMKMNGFANVTELQALVAGFERGDLPRAQWTHAAHQAVAFWYLVSCPFEEAKVKIRNGIQRYNAAQGIKNTPDTGYHETITLFWIELVRHYLVTATLENHLITLLNELIARYDKDTPLHYYSRERLFSREARHEWLAPNLLPLPSEWEKSAGGE